MREVDPVALEDVFHFEVEQLLVGEGGAIQLVDVFLRILVQHRLQFGEVGSVVLVDLNHADLLYADGLKGLPPVPTPSEAVTDEPTYRSTGMSIHRV